MPHCAVSPWASVGVGDEVGWLGSLRNVQKVNSFTRTLVSVADLVEQFGVVMFDTSGAYLGSKYRGKTLITKIGSSTPDRLYRFDQPALERHVEKLPDLRAGSSRVSDLPELLRSWGCANGATAG